MDQYMPHADYILPTCIRMGILKLGSEHVCSLSYNLHIFYDSEV